MFTAISDHALEGSKAWLCLPVSTKDWQIARKIPLGKQRGKIRIIHPLFTIEIKSVFVQ